MVSFERKSSNWGVIKASTEEWASIKSLIEHVAQPDVFHDSELDVMSGLDHEDWQLWVNKFSTYDEPPNLIARSELCVLFATVTSAEDAKVKGLSDDHKLMIDELQHHRMNEAVDCG